MTNYTELKRLAEDCKEREIDFADVLPQQGSTSCDKLVRHYIAEVLPDTLLSMIDALDVQAGSIEAVQAVNQRLASERDRLRTQNQALAKEMRYIAGISNGQVKRVADQALAAAAIGEAI